MSYYNQMDYSALVHTLSVKGPIKTDAVRLLVDCEEALAKLGYISTLQVQIFREADKPAVESAPEGNGPHGEQVCFDCGQTSDN